VLKRLKEKNNESKKITSNHIVINNDKTKLHYWSPNFHKPTIFAHKL